jgi:S-adenosylmethionine:tRNA ribosyltransferase-isomerase
MKNKEAENIPASPQDIDINEYDYELPDERIAKFPLPERDASRLLLYNRGQIGHRIFRDLPDILPPNALLLFNNTRVIHARLVFQRSTGARIEVFCLEPLSPVEHQQSLSSEEPVVWACLIGNNKRWKEKELKLTVKTPNGPVNLYAERLAPHEDVFAVRFRWESPRPIAFGEILHYAGLIPLPPYLHRESVPSDEDRYQTVYARQEGSVAAPTAGLHFTDRVFEGLKKKGVETAYVTLHVGAGTFRPVKSERLGEHPMHEEQLFVTRKTIAALRDAVEAGRPVIPVGTTSLRTLESLYWCGVNPAVLLNNAYHHQPLVAQWDPYQTAVEYAPAEALNRLLEALQTKGEHTLTGSTQLLIAPGYTYRLATGLITNFHQPRSTLLLLVAALVGQDWRRIYDYALENDFRFLSYGDSMFVGSA